MSVPTCVFEHHDAVILKKNDLNLVLSGCITFLVHIMDPGTTGTHKARRASDACGKQFATSYAFDQHRRSGYLIGIMCHILDDGSTRSLRVGTF